ncbi:MAG: hypothetical protein MI717_09630 [Spirochaetales bacterium]|nr:hypothetical protein [Spirochaetales bacterium]
MSSELNDLWFDWESETFRLKTTALCGATPHEAIDEARKRLKKLDQMLDKFEELQSEGDSE